MLPLLVLGLDDDQPPFDVVPLADDEMEKLVADGADVKMNALPAIHEF